MKINQVGFAIIKIWLTKRFKGSVVYFASLPWCMQCLCLWMENPNGYPAIIFNNLIMEPLSMDYELQIYELQIYISHLSQFLTIKGEWCNGEN
jgi:hypothetical protein